MRSKKMLGLVVCALAVMAFAGTTGAFAVKKTVGCKVNEEPCAAKNIFPAGTVGKGRLKVGTEALLKTSVGTVACKSGTAEGKSLEEVGSLAPPEGEALMIEGVITSSTLSECVFAGLTKCTVTMTNLPWHSTLQWTSANTGIARIGAFEKGKEPGGKVVCGAFINCTFRTNNAKETVHGGNPATGEIKEAPLEKVEGGLVCPKEARLSGQGEALEPNPLFISYVN